MYNTFGNIIAKTSNISFQLLLSLSLSLCLSLSHCLSQIPMFRSNCITKMRNNSRGNQQLKRRH